MTSYSREVIMDSASKGELNYSLGIDFFKPSSRMGRINHLGLFSIWTAFILWGAFIPELLPHCPRTVTSTITLLFLLLGITNILFIAMKRLNDFNFRGIWVLFCGIPFVGLFWYLTIFMIPGSTEENRYGTRPADPTLKNYLPILATPVTSLLIYLL